MSSLQEKMDAFRWDIMPSLESLVTCGCIMAEPILIKTCQELLAKQMWTPKDRQQLLYTLSHYLLYPHCTLPIVKAFRPILLDILERACQGVNITGCFSLEEHEQLCVALGKVLGFHPDAYRFLMAYLSNVPPVFERLLRGKTGMKEKKKKKLKVKKAGRAPPTSLTDILSTCYRYLEFARESFVDLWDWSPVLKLVDHEDINARWYSLRITATVTNMSDQQAQQFLINHFTPADLRRIMVMHEESRRFEISSHNAHLLNQHTTFNLTEYDQGKHMMHEVVTADMSPSIAAVCGVLLPIKPGHQNQQATQRIVEVPSTVRNLHRLALAVSSGTAVLLEGVVGCGKSALVDHLAQVTGRRKTPHLLKVQLGDQTDSKALIGTYRCTDVPGEFVWQAGALTQAVTNGNWIMLEDIDYAPMDVVSVLVPLLEAGSLTLPGHGDVVHAAPGFQLFATQRLMAGADGFFRQHSSHAALLDQMWSKVILEPLAKEELQQIVVTLHPNLTALVVKLLDIFCMLSSGNHETQTTQGDSSLLTQHSCMVTPDVISGHQGRLISTRDLLKWCGRVATGFDASQSNISNRIFLEAMDCFCAALAKPKTRISVAEAVGVRLGLSLEKCNFFCISYKPSIDIQQNRVTVGRAMLSKMENETPCIPKLQKSSFAFTRQASVLLERVAVCINNNEPVLLVGETGTGKTSSVQYLADITGQRLKVINMNQQSDSTDLLGGFKPVNFRQLMAPVREEFEALFVRTFSRKQNIKFLMHVQECFSCQRWQDLLKLMSHCHQTAIKRFQKESYDEDESSSHGKQSPTVRSQWRSIGERIHLVKTQLQHTENALAFSFVEGTLVQAVKNGDWVLLDEINLATAETLECLSGLLESTQGTVTLHERGDLEPIVRHSDFRLFACMNPATDVGKKELPPGVRNRFTEIYVDELEETQDLKILVTSYLKGLSLPPSKLDGIVQFYLAVRKEAEIKLADGTGHRPHYSLRTLCRALHYASSNPCRNVLRSLYESFCLSFLTQLDRASHPFVEQLICKKLIGLSNMKSILGHPIPPPTGGMYTKIEGYWIATGDGEPVKQKDYVMTPSVQANLRNLARIVSACSFPVLLQGETSVGKTSLIQFLALATGNHCVRVNNHEHTDLQEYVGFYAADEMGKLVFKEGVLVNAMRKGHWIILDELNLAPSDVLEALNRLLDDNRELYIPETQEMVSAHPRFMLFATQNPPGQYGGRKVLSRAFRNRFVELHFDEIPSKELKTILHQRCAIPLSYCNKMVAVMLDLQTRRKGSGVFSGKQGFITLRDLFRWAERYRQASQGQGTLYDWDQHIAEDGYLLLAGRVRRPEEQSLIKEVLEKHIRCKVDPSCLFDLTPQTSPITRGILERVLDGVALEDFGHIVWTLGMRRLAVLVGQALKFQEPVLLVGDTGCGKTSICQLYSALASQKLYSVNCHLHMETSDFLGGLRPVRHYGSEQAEDKQKLFEWCDGPLVLAMREDAGFLIDEISLADDSVLERLNSVLEPERTLLLAEQGSGENQGEDIDEIVAGKQFFVVATMNPGGDFGKKELSPALRNRFTEIWCPQSNNPQDLVDIIEHNLAEGVWLCNQEDGSSGVGNAIIEFVKWFQSSDAGKRCTVSIRDILSWVNFINSCCDTSCSKQRQVTRGEGLDTALAYLHGACLVFLDGLGSGSTSNASLTPKQARCLSLNFLRNQIWQKVGQDIDLTSLMVTPEVSRLEGVKLTGSSDGLFGIEPFYISKGPSPSSPDRDDYALNAPTTALNAQRILRAMQLHRPILLEGSPGVGKTSLVSAISKASGHNLIRINLSEQTDVADLFGADLPVEGGEGGQFAWRDGPLLSALKEGHWVVLDELNLASQSVLEGLNACLDHRAEVFIPELGKTFHIQHEKTHFFACQNPLKQGGGRKGLPQSFLNRFTQVFIEPLTPGDLLFITHTVYPKLDVDLLEKIVAFNNQLHHETMVEYQWGQRGGPWEFNLRDIFRWCDLMIHDQHHDNWQPGQHVGLIYKDRMRSQQDKLKVEDLYKTVFGDNYTEMYGGSRYVHVTPISLQVGHSFLKRRDHMESPQQQNHKIPLQLLHHSLDPLESIMKCVEMNWMTILVGPSASGKTSLVHLLGHLTGHRVRVLAMNSSMDTTELLGGFEQADLNRHWEKALQSLRFVVMATERLLLLAKDDNISQHAPQLQASFAALLSMNQTGSTRTSSSSTVTLNTCLSERKLDMFDQVLEEVKQLAMLQKTVTYINECVCQVTTIAAELRMRFEREGHTIQQGGGGKFEWVDGLLVQALKHGDWLLIDNVNFCSPSVLDRLNALLEPNGVLSINERGVIDGHIPTIKPHPDFRLILAMDPRHGEISRAMRNRGVEIYIIGENEGGNYDQLDLQSLLVGIGLVGDQVTGPLLKVHEDIKLHLPGCDVASLSGVLLAASITVQLLERGRDLKTALNHACNDVFVLGQLSKVNKEKAQEIVRKHLCVDGNMGFHQKVLDDTEPILPMEIEESMSKESILHPHFLPSADELSSNASWAMIRRKTALLMCLLAEAKNLWNANAESSLSSGNGEVELHPVIPLIRPAVLLLLQQATHTDWQLQNQWLLTTWKELLPSNKRIIDMEGAEFVKNMPEIAVESVTAVFQHPLRQRLSMVLQKLESPEDVRMLEHYPCDLNLAPQLQIHLTTLGQKKAPAISTTDTPEREMSSIVKDVLDEAVSIGRRLYLILMTAVMCHEGYSKLKLAVDVKHKATTAIQLSYAYHQGVIGVEDLDHPLLVHIYPFFKELDSFITEAISAESPRLSEDVTYEILLALNWRERCWQQCDRPIQGKDSFHLGQFALHWQWILKKVISIISNLLLGNNIGVPQTLQAVIDRISDQLTATATAPNAPEHQKALLHHLGQPLPYKTNLSAEISFQIHKLCQVIDIASPVAKTGISQLGKHKKRKLERCVHFVVRDSGSTCKKLIELLLTAAELNNQAVDCIDGDLLDSIQGLEASLVAQRLYPQDSSQHISMETDEDADQLDNLKVKTVVASRVGMWPLCEYLALTAEQDTLNCLLRMKLKREEYTLMRTCDRIRSMVEYTLRHTPSLPLHILPYASLLQSELLHDPSISELTAAFMNHLWKSPATCQVSLWLSWRQHLGYEKVESSMDTIDIHAESMEYGLANLHTPLQTQCIIQLLYAPSQQHHEISKRADEERGIHKMTGSKVTKDVSLGQYLEKVEQLKALSELLWSNSTVVSIDKHGFRSNSVMNLLLTLSQLLQTLEPLLLTSDLKTWQSALDDIISVKNFTSMDNSPVVFAVTTLEEILSKNMIACACQPRTYSDMRGHGSNTTLTDIGADIKMILECILNLLKAEDVTLGERGCNDEEAIVRETKGMSHMFDLMELGKGWVHLGLTDAHLIAPRGPVDPAEKKALKLQYVKKEMTNISNELKVRHLSSQLLTGQSFEDVPTNQLTERVCLTKKRLQLLEERAQELAKHMAFRPDLPKFDALLQDMTLYLSSIGSRSTVEGLIHKLTSAFKSICTGKLEGQQTSSFKKVLNEEKAWQKSQLQFLNRIGKEYPLYRDQWEGLTVAVMQMQYGMRLAAHALHSLSEQRNFSDVNSPIEACIYSLIDFPAQSCSDRHLMSTNILQLVKRLSDYSAGEMQCVDYQIIKKSLLLLSLVHARNQALLLGHLDAQSSQTLLNILDTIVVIWRQAEDMVKQKEEEEASLYKYKAKIHGDGLTDEERDEQEFRQTFPSFDKDFADITAEPTLDSGPDAVDGESSDKENKTSVVQFSQQQMQQICCIHQELFTKLVQTMWTRSQHHSHPMGDELYCHMLEDGYSTMVTLSKGVLPFLDPCIDSRLLGSHLLMIRSLQTTLTQSDKSTTARNSQPYDIYHDSNINESVQCRPLLERFYARISELLSQWPEHPTLTQLVLLIERILEFPITCPLMKFVTGLELLLEKAQEWESNASRAVSVGEHLKQVTDLVIQWRKLELRCWSTCLDTVAYRLEQSTNKWWFYIYQLLQSHLGSDYPEGHSHGVSDNQRDCEQKDDKVDTAQSILAALESFIEGASLGEFSARLQMLQSFHCQVAIQPHSQKQQELISVLWNLHCYYKQFLLTVEAEIKTRRAPIEKELKDFVKIARWNDINFWSVKLAVDKSHKTLHKFTKKFEMELKESARCAFTDTRVAENEDIPSEDSSSSRPTSFDGFLTPHDFKSYFDVHEIPPAATILQSGKSLHLRLPRFLPRMTKLCHTIFKKCQYPTLAKAVDEFTGDIVSGVKELQSLDVSKDADKEKQKKEVHRIQQRKRKALADLFRYLSTIGLSYRKGLSLTRVSNQSDTMFIPPVDLGVALQSEDTSFSLKQTETVAMWEDSQKYFVKSVAREAAMQMALAVPSKELGIGNIERCKGFAKHLSTLAATQRRDIISITEGLVETRNMLSQLHQLKATCFHGNDPLLPPQQSMASWVMTLKGLLDLSRETSYQYSMLLDCCPQNNNDSGELPSPLPRECLVTMDTVRKGDALWVQTKEKLQECLSILELVNQRLEPRVSRLAQKCNLQLLFWSDFQLLNDAFDKIETVCNALEDIEQLYSLPQSGEKSCLSASLTSTKQRLLEMILEYNRWKRMVVCLGAGEEDDKKQQMEDESFSHLEDFASRTESVLASILLAVQTMVKAHDTSQTENQPATGDYFSTDKEAADLQDEVDQDFDLQDGHLVKHLSSALGNDAITLDLGQVSKAMSSLLCDLQDRRDCCHSALEIQEFNDCGALLLRLVPILHQYLGLVSFTLSQTVACHRTTCKLLSVLLGIFTELAAKGFCLPAEYSNELGGDGATEFQDIEGGGIGEGEGIKDVSDQIENEEQVQDTKKPGDKEEDFSNQPDIKDEEQGIEMSEDFQGKLHDGEGKEGDSDEDENEEHEMDKQMGEVDQPGADMLDQRMWGDEQEEEEDQVKEGEKKEEFGDGRGEEKKTEMVAKEDNQGAAEDRNEEEKPGEEGDEETGENKEDQRPNNLEPQDEGEFNDEDVDPHKANEPPQAPVPQELDIPDDLNLDGEKMDEENGEGESENQDETNPFDIETKLPDQTEPGNDPNETSDIENAENQDDGNQDEGNQGMEPKVEDSGEEADEDLEAEEGQDGGDNDEGKDDGEDGEQKGGIGIEPQDDDNEPIPEDSNSDYQPDKAHHPQAMPEPAENYGKSQEKTETVHDLLDKEDAGKSEEDKNKEKENVGSAESSLEKGHDGTAPTKTLPRHDQSEHRQNIKRHPGQADIDRSLGSSEERIHKRLRTMEAPDKKADNQNQESQDNEQAEKDESSDLYEHIKDASSHYDTQMMDVASEEQLAEEQAFPKQEEEDAVVMETDEEIAPLDEDMKTNDDTDQNDKASGTKIRVIERQSEDDLNEPNPAVTEGDGDDDGTAGPVKDIMDNSEIQASTIHTTLGLLFSEATPQYMTMEELEAMRREMEKQLSMLCEKQGTVEQVREAQETWHRYEFLTSGLARDLCEQLRLVLEPTRASKLRGDFRTGKRINMRKVIPYIASGFRKDKIWLRRTKPSKRQYQILLAVDDSSSMADNRSKQLAFESLAVISNALTWLEAGELAVCSFGESVQLLHSFHEPFTDQSGANILRQFTFSQSKTKIAQLLHYATASMLSARSRLQSASSHMETSQLLLIISDGRGLFLEGMEAVNAAVRRARDANVFLVFVALDNPQNKDSILDIKIPIFGSGSELPQITTYMEHFPFPFYIILKDINSMPVVLSDALRQWFELVTAGDIK